VILGEYSYTSGLALERYYNLKSIKVWCSLLTPSNTPYCWKTWLHHSHRPWIVVELPKKTIIFGCTDIKPNDFYVQDGELQGSILRQLLFIPHSSVVHNSVTNNIFVIVSYAWPIDIILWLSHGRRTFQECVITRKRYLIKKLRTWNQPINQCLTSYEIYNGSGCHEQMLMSPGTLHHSLRLFHINHDNSIIKCLIWN
jgi:hypothetical protein